MVDKIEMSLDDIIKSNRDGRRGGVRRGAPQRNGAGGGVRRTTGGRSPRKIGGGGILRNRGTGGIQKAKFARGDVNSAWKHDMYDGPKRGILKSADLAKLQVSNLDYGVSDSDIHELFAEFGPLKKATIHYDRSGRSLGTANIVFERRADAMKALKQYNGVPLDGRPMNIQLASDVTSLVRPTRLGSAGSPRKVRPGSAPVSRGATTTQRRGTASRARGGNAGGGRRKDPAPTAEELDAELDAYVNDMKT